MGADGRVLTCYWTITAWVRFADSREITCLCSVCTAEQSETADDIARLFVSELSSTFAAAAQDLQDIFRKVSRDD
jgi:hypothetical protein